MDQPKIKILLVDDEDFVRELLARYLKGDTRLQIDEASDGFTAVSKTIMKSYHLAILDVAMPHFNGIEAIKNMQANCPELKFIIVTGL
ncbi:MAG TPA: response regulator, partial [Bdellovibrionota bacterium]|nr:response regulator [Bdellovibrionota bacterium]